MAGLQRSAVSFRRQGSSGLVWDDRFVSGELNKVNQKDDQQEQEDLEHHHNKGTSSHGEIKELNTSGTTTSHASLNTTNIERSRSNGGSRGYRTGKVSPAIEPPSPKLSACGLCGAFGKAGGGKGQRSKPGKHRSR